MTPGKEATATATASQSYSAIATATAAAAATNTFAAAAAPGKAAASEGGDSGAWSARACTMAAFAPMVGRQALSLLLACAVGLLAACNAARPLTPAWQQDSNLYYQGMPARQAQSSTTPHVVSRIIYAPPAQLSRLLEKQGDVADAQRGPARMGDGTLDVGVQDAVTGRWLESYLCGGHLFVAALPNQAYRLVLKNRTPLPLQLSVGVDGRDVETGAAASLRRGGLRLPARGMLAVDRGSRGPLLFRSVRDDMVLYDMSPRGRPGVIQLATYLADEAPSVGPEKMRPSQVLPLSLFPIGAPEQYR